METATLDAGLASTTNTTAPAAPSSTPTTAASPVERPTSWDDAFEKTSHLEAEAPTPEPAPTTPVVQDGQAPATAEPPPAPVDATAPENTGPIPFHVHKTALENARKKASEEAVQQFQQQHADALSNWEALSRDVPGTLIQMLDEAMRVPQFAQVITSHAAKVMAGRRGQQPQHQQPQAEPEPPMFVDGPNGEVIYDPGQVRKWQEWNARKTRAELEQQFSQQFAPLMELSQGVQQARQHETQVQQAVENFRPLLAEWEQMPGFTEHKAAIVKRQSELFEQAFNAGQRVDHMALLTRAYREIVPHKLQAQQQQTVQQHQQQLVASAVAKSTGRTDNPAAAAPAAPRRPRSFDEAFEQAFDGFSG